MTRETFQSATSLIVLLLASAVGIAFGSHFNEKLAVTPAEVLAELHEARQLFDHRAAEVLAEIRLLRADVAEKK